MATQSKIILSIKEHNQLSYVFTAYEVVQQNEEYYSILSNVKPNDRLLTTINNPALSQIINLIQKYSDENLYKNYVPNRKISISEFFSKLDEKLRDDHIRPFIDKIHKKIYDILFENPDIEIYYKHKNYENIYFSDRCYVSNIKAKTIFNFERNENGLKYWLSVYFKDHEIYIYKKKPIILCNSPAIIELEHIIMSVEDTDAKKLQPFYEKPYIEVPKSAELKYFQNFILKTVVHNNVKAINFEIKSITLQPQPVLCLQHSLNGSLQLSLYFLYKNKKFYHNDKTQCFVEFDQKTFVITKYFRNFDKEKEIIEQLLQNGIKLVDDTHFSVSSTEKPSNIDFANIEWVNTHYNWLSEKGFGIEQQFADKNYFLKKVELNIDINEQTDWFDLKAIVKAGDIEIPFYKIKDNILSGKREYLLENGQILIIPEVWFAKYSELLKFSKRSSDETLRVNKVHLSLFYPQNNIAIENIKKYIEFINNPIKNSNILPQSLKTHLRNYQKQGYNWLLNLYNLNLGGILADDMGLGKTIQILTLIQKITEQSNNLTNLVIVPRSLIHNWINEINKHTQLRSLLYFGTERQNMLRKIQQFDIIVTSYGTARNDAELLSTIEFDTIILDESQYIKNPNSKTYISLKKLKAHRKISLTGTPIENSLHDLWSQMNFVNQGLLGSLTFFKKNFIVPIEKNKCVETKNKLKKLISPFILRRTKSEVVQDLPQLQINTVICEMTPEQKYIYEQEKSKLRNKILELYHSNNLEQAKFFVLQSITRLRQISNHPQILFKNYQHSSGKYDEIINRLNVLLKENHKVLIFSTFVSMLKIFENYFISNNIPYKILTGETQNRQTIVDSFEKDYNTKIFLMSIKAGGFGLNIVSADYVFIVDPWWNPAVEQQAIARAHRIGQTRNVFAYRFITYDTVEQKIQKLQNHKIEISKDLIDTDQYYKYFDYEEIINLFE